MKIINGRLIAASIFKQIAKRLAAETSTRPFLAVILVGNNPSSHLYVSIKEKKAAQLGIGFQKYLFSAKTSTEKIAALIKKLNTDPTVSGIIIQLPLPKKINGPKIISLISPAKDADGIHPRNLNLLRQGKELILPATTAAIISALQWAQINLKNKSVAVIGKSLIVGLPTYYYLRRRVKKIAIYDSKTKNLAAKTSLADIIIVAIGCPEFITADYVKKSAAVIDVGINKINGRTVGDVDSSDVARQADYLTPVPGGIGPLTVACLLRNTVLLAKKNDKICFPDKPK